MNNNAFKLLLIILAIILILILVGCGSETRIEESGQIMGSFNGQPVQIAWTKTGTRSMTFTMPQIDTGGLLSSGNPWVIGAGILTALLGGGGIAKAQSLSKQCEYHKSDAAELYEDLKKAKGLT